MSTTSVRKLKTIKLDIVSLISRESADAKARRAIMKAEEDAAAVEQAADKQDAIMMLEMQWLQYQVQKEAAAQIRAAEEGLTAESDEIRDKAVAAVDTMAATIEKYATALTAAHKATAGSLAMQAAGRQARVQESQTRGAGS